MPATDSASFTITSLRMAVGVIIWAAHFAIIYGYTGLACARRFEASGETWVASVPWVVGIATAAGVLLAIVFVVPAVRASRRAFVEWMSGWVAAFAVLAMILEGIAVLWVPVCG